MEKTKLDLYLETIAIKTKKRVAMHLGKYGEVRKLQKQEDISLSKLKKPA